MTEEFCMNAIAHIRSVFPEKFGIPRQSGLSRFTSEIVFEPEYRVPEAFRGLDGYSHLWLLWVFSETAREQWSPTVRPPRLGGNVRMGVFATRSPYRPNPVGLSSVKLERIDFSQKEGPVLYVAGADLMDGTPILDIKPYLAYTDSHPEASEGFALRQTEGTLSVEFPPELLERIPENLRDGLMEILSQDPRPGYQTSAQRVYSMRFWKADVRFTVEGQRLSVCGVEMPEENTLEKRG